ncbi:MAG: sugar ABC transporter substrate-binding protein [Lachnospiraceae bacterium]|nr:sugar ABC transporter substrate-binding protein [Lachnospiraceae bacterium]
MRKKILSAALAGIMALSLAGCGGGNSGSEGGNQAASGKDAGGTLTVAIWDNGQKAGLEKIMADYTAATGNKAELQVITWNEYWTLLEAGASGGDMPDVFWMHSNEARKYMENDILMDLTDRIAGSEKLEMDKFPQDIKEMYTCDGKTYAIPKDVDTIALWYNKTMFDEAGIAYPDESWTWDDFYDAAVKLTKEDGSQYGVAMNPSNEQDGWMNIIYSMGGKVLTDDKKASGFDDPNTIKAMEYVQKLVDNAMPPATVMAETGTDVLLGSGKIAMLSQGSWMLPAFKEHEYISQNCDIAVLPKDAETGNRVSLYNGLGWAVNAKTKNPEAAWQLVEWFGTKDAQLKQAQLGVTMAAYEGVSDEWKNSTDLFNLQPYLDMRENIVFRPATRATLTWWNPMCNTFKEAWNGNMAMNDACLKVAEDMNKAISEE